MKRKLVQAGSSLAVTLPVEVVREFKLSKGAEVDVSVHPQTGAVTIRPGVRQLEDGRVTRRVQKLADELLERRAALYRALAPVTLYLSLEQLLWLHERQARSFGGARGLRDRGALESALARPRATFGGEDLHADVESKAAALMHSLVMNHPFLDGNKRLGALAAELFLDVNGVDLLSTDEELLAVTLTVARGEMSAEELAIWLRQRSRRRVG